MDDGLTNDRREIMLDFEFDEPAGILCCRFHDRMDSVQTLEASAILSDKLTALGHPAVTDDSAAMTQPSLSPVNQIVFDLAQVDYISSGFMRLCAKTAKAVQEGNFSVINTKPLVMKVFKVAGLDELLKVS